jgi:hypothetical protein
VPHEALLHPERGADIINQRPIGVPKAVPAHSLQSDLFTGWSQVVFLNGVAVDWALCIRISEQPSLRRFDTSLPPILQNGHELGMVEITACRLLLVNLLGPLAKGEAMTQEGFDGIVDEVKKQKARVARDRLKDHQARR